MGLPKKHHMNDDLRAKLDRAMERGDYEVLLDVYLDFNGTDPIRLFPEYSMDELHRYFEMGAREYAGGFVKSLSNTYWKGDTHNRMKLRRTFARYFVKYVCFGRGVEKEKKRAEK
jgi:hypothetical protein